MAAASLSESIKTRSSSGHGSDESIINRKIERRGIPGSFSANLSNRASPPRSAVPAAGTMLPANSNRDGTAAGAAHGTGQGAGTSGNTSVKAIVAWLESSTRDEAKSLTSVSSDARSKSSLTASTLSRYAAAAFTAPNPQQQQQHTLSMAPDVEDYSLTLLKYREYFTEKPLGRCLDTKPEDTAGFSVGPVLVDKCDYDESPRVKLSPNRQYQAAVSVGKTSDDDDAELSRTGRRSDGSEATMPPRNNHDSHQAVGATPAAPCRDPAEVEAFWTAVRTYLRISNDELEQVEDHHCDRPSESFPSIPLQDAPESPSYNFEDNWSLISVREVSPHRRGHSEPSVSPVRHRRRKRFLSVEEKILEIDHFLGTT